MSTKTARCAIYTRKSSEEGLEQNFNSLHAQREACEAFIKSQSHEGWTLISTAYDDGGYSGGSMERPALKRLMADIEAKKIDTIVVYKVDRLTRSLADFAKIVEALDRQGVSFVSVTQQFNTTSSMGRLTLNVLLSFAQFEREVTGERIRDKFAASKQKGMWMGGPVPLGYDVKERKLVVNEAEAETVRQIYRTYLELGTVPKLVEALKAAGITSKKTILGNERIRGGGFMARGALYCLLRNRIYLGEITHKGKIYDGQHDAIVPKELWDKARTLLQKVAVPPSGRRYSKYPVPLRGRLFDSAGHEMVARTSFKKDSRRYRYYMSKAVVTGNRTAGGEIKFIPAHVIEPLLLGHLTKNPIEDLDEVERAALFAKIGRATLYGDRVAVEPADFLKTKPFEIPIQLHRSRAEIIVTTTALGGQPVAPRIDKLLVRALARAHAMRLKLESGEATTVPDLMAQFGLAESYIRKILPIGFLAPDLMEQILDGRQPARLQLGRISDGKLPFDWAKQRALFAELKR
jgi:DNA invertase Pin-like site-specific DNA recombinase